MSRLKVILSVALVSLMSVVTITACRNAPFSTSVAQKSMRATSSATSYSSQETPVSSSEVSSAVQSSSSEVSSGPSKTVPSSQPSSTPSAASTVPPPTPASSAVVQPVVQVTAVAVSPSSASSATPSSTVQLATPTSPWADTGLQGISKVYEYGKTLLDAQQQSFYDQLVKGVTNMNSQITIATSLTPPDMETIFRYCMQDHAEIFYVSGAGISYTYDPHTNTYYSYTYYLTYEYSSGEVQSMRAQMATGAAQMISEAKASLTAEGKDASNTLNMETALHDTLVNDLSYDMAEYNTPGSRPMSHQAYGAFANKTAVCDGYSRALKLLLDSQGIKSILVEGTDVTSSGSGGHAWNMVQVGGVWYYLDATFDDPVFINSSGYDPTKSTISHTYFNYIFKSDHVLGIFNVADPFAASSENYKIMLNVG